MKKLKFFQIVFIAIIGITVGFWIYQQQFQYSHKGTINIAVAGPISGPSSHSGQVIRQGVRLFVDKLNSQGGIDGKRVVVHYYDDQNKEMIAGEMALEIAKNSQVLGVIGHNYSKCSLKAGEVYQEYGVPAITPSSTNVNVTRGNPWYFRNIFDNDLQARFLANYIRSVFQETKVSIVYDDSDYGTALATTFDRMVQAMGVEVVHKWQFNTDDAHPDRAYRRIVFDLQRKKNDAGTVFIATHATEAAALVKLIKDSLIKNRLLLPDSCATEAFPQLFAYYPKEQRFPGYYTSGIYVATPLIFDTSTQNTQQFEKEYQATFSDRADWQAAFAYDAAMILIEAIRNSGVTGNPEDLARDRKKIRDYLAGITTPDKGIDGITGLTWFNMHGDAIKPISIGIYKSRNIISALTQLQPLYNIYEVPNFEQQMKKGLIVLFGGRYMYRTNVVYTGIKINSIDQFDFKNMTCEMDFDIWFRFEGNLDDRNIEFTNAVTSIQLDKPVQEEINGGLISRRYRVKGRFKSDFVANPLLFGYHILGFRFRHKELTRNNLIYVTDILGMGLLYPEKTMADILRRDQVIAPGSDWIVEETRFIQDVYNENIMGRLEYIDSLQKNLEFSQFNFTVLLKRNRLSIRGIISQQSAQYIWISFSMLFLLTFLGRIEFILRFQRSLWAIRLISMAIVLLSGEVDLIWRLASDNVSPFIISGVVKTFDILWWIVPAWFLNHGIGLFVWAPLERKTGKLIPAVIRRMVTIIIIFFAIYAVIVFVFDQDITKLMATSGVIAMVFGLIIKANISNFFSGVVINQSDSLRIGDWVKIDGFPEGKVKDITWRETKLTARDGNVLSIPNTTVLDAAIHNFSYPNPKNDVEVTVHLDPELEPDRMKKILLDAVMTLDGIASQPSVKFKGFTDWSAVYSVSFSIPDYGKKSAFEESAWIRIYRHLKAEGISPEMKSGEVPPGPKNQLLDKKNVAQPDRILDNVHVLRALPEESKHFLADRMKLHRFSPGDLIVKQGDVGNSLFIIAEGVVGVWIQFESGQEPIEIARMGVGSFFGEMALLTGNPRNATIISTTATRLYEITREDFAPLIENNPELAKQLSEILAKRQLDIDFHRPEGKKTDKSPSDNQAQQASLLKKIQRFFTQQKSAEDHEIFLK